MERECRRSENEQRHRQKDEKQQQPPARAQPSIRQHKVVIEIHAAGTTVLVNRLIFAEAERIR